MELGVLSGPSNFRLNKIGFYWAAFYDLQKEIKRSLFFEAPETQKFVTSSMLSIQIFLPV